MAKTEKTHPMFFWRKANDRSLQSVADELGCTQSFLSQIELYEKQPSLTMATRLCRVTGIPVEQFARNVEAAQ
jgi:transcriptional regulator with XRE-family HTH domain